MTTKIAQVPASTATPEQTAPTSPSTITADLPTFDWDAGYKYVYNSETGTHDQVQLTLLDILYPTEDDIGKVIVTQSFLHDLWTNWLKVMLQTFLGSGWLVFSDVLIHWAHEGVPSKSPDITAIPGASFPAERKSYRVGPDGPLPTFILEITSEASQAADLQEKVSLYAAVGIKEYLIIDLLPDDDDGPWQLLGYRLEDGPYYNKLAPDLAGGLTFETIGLGFMAVGRERINVYEIKTGNPLLTPDKLQAYAEAEAARAEAEATARKAAEARVAELEVRLQELQTRSQEQAVNDE